MSAVHELHPSGTARDAAPPTITDLANARRLVAEHGDDLLYVPELGDWHYYDGTHFARDVTGEVDRRAKQVVDGLRDLVFEAPDAKAQKGLFGAWQRAQGAPRIRGMVELAATEPGIARRAEELDANPYLLNAENGTVDLLTGDLLPHSPADLCTKVTAASYMPGLTSPTLEKFLSRIFGDDRELIDFVQRALGLALTGDVSEQYLLLLYGSGANGKSTLVNTVRRILRDYAVQLSPDLLLATRNHDRHPTGLTDLRGARFASTVEVEQGRQLAEALVKMLTGGEPIRARRMHRDFFEFEPTHHLWFTVNHLPRITGRDLGIWRRVLVVPFTVEIPEGERDPMLGEKLWAERDAILTWMVEGCLAWQAAGLRPPRTVEAATAQYRQAEDHLGGFLAACCDIDSTKTADAKLLYARYEQWCDETGSEPMSKTGFGRAMADGGYPTTKDRRRRQGLGLR